MEKYRSETSVAYSDSTISSDDQFEIESSGISSDGALRNRLRHSGSTDDSCAAPARTDHRPHALVQRSKSDVRHNSSRPPRLQEIRRGSNFELAYLLQKGRTLDAKLFGEECAEEDEDQPKMRRGSSDDGSSSPGSRIGAGGGGGGGGRIVLLPLRLRHALTKRRFSSSRIYPPRTSICGSLQGSTVSISGPLDSLPELQPTEMLSQQSATISCSQAQKDKDLETAILWLQQEIHSLKTQDRKLFRQLLGLGTEIHRMSGMKTCQSVNQSLDDDTDVTRRFVENEADENYFDRDDDEHSTQGSLDNAAWQPKSNSELNSLKNNKLIDLYTSSDSFFL